MRRRDCDVLVVGGGPAGLAAAWQARESGAQDVLVIERSHDLGGILPQCIHNGFGVSTFGEDLTGPEYASRWIRQAQTGGVSCLTDTMVLELGPDLRAVASNGNTGLVDVQAKAIVLSMGCRERPRGALAIPGTRPVGVYTAGTAQRLVNIEGHMPGRRFVILGSGDIGMIMARRLTLEGATVAAMVEIRPYVSGLRRNLVQCVHDFDIPLHLCTTVIEVKGEGRVDSVVTSPVDDRWQPVAGSAQEIACDALLLSVGLIPENELSRSLGVEIDARTGGPVVDQRFCTSVPGVFVAGNVLHVYDLVDEVTRSALTAGRYAAEYALVGQSETVTQGLEVRAGHNVLHVVPQRVGRAALQCDGVKLEFRAREPIEAAVRAEVLVGTEVVVSRRLRYARPSEMIAVEVRPRDLAKATHAPLANGEPLSVRLSRVDD